MTAGGKPVRAMLVYVCVPKGLNVESDHAYHVTSHMVTSESGATLKIITSVYGANEYGLPIEGGKQDRTDIKCLDFPGTDIRAVQSDGKRARSMTSFPVSIYYDWTDAEESNLFDEIFSFGCHNDGTIEKLAP
ncbi:MAG: hypothetical protein HY646_16025 [Acidobacteria bacterium]|nr:hypothetical protein [Acidobacteriota bacterium]